MSDFEIIYRSLQEQYPGRLLIGVKDVAKIFDCSVKSIYNGTHRKAVKRFPVQPVSGPGKKFKLLDCAKVLASM